VPFSRKTKEKKLKRGRGKETKIKRKEKSEKHLKPQILYENHPLDISIY
jgi:hypothetical protein